MIPTLDKSWIPLKRFRYEESMRLHLSETRIAQKIKAGEYPSLKTIRLNQRVVWVQNILRSTGREPETGKVRTAESVIKGMEELRKFKLFGDGL